MLLPLYDVAAASSGAADNEIGDEGVKALADALAPKQNPDGTWTYNNALKSLDLYCASSLPAHSSPTPPFIL